MKTSKTLEQTESRRRLAWLGRLEEILKILHCIVI